MIAFAIVAAQFAAPVPVEPYPWFSSKDVPGIIRMRGGELMVGTRTVFRPDGTVQSCDIERSSGDPKIDSYTCDLIEKRAKVRPARWLDKSPAYGVFRLPVAWTTGSRHFAGADAQIAMDQLPSGVKSPAYVGLSIAVDAAGRAVACARRTGENQPALVDLACAEVMKRFKPVRPVDSSGKPVQSVQTASVAITRR